jgi:hypothetical protein
MLLQIMQLLLGRSATSSDDRCVWEQTRWNMDATWFTYRAASTLPQYLRENFSCAHHMMWPLWIMLNFATRQVHHLPYIIRSSYICIPADFILIDRISFCSTYRLYVYVCPWSYQTPSELPQRPCDSNWTNQAAIMPETWVRGYRVILELNRSSSWC